MTTLQPAQLLRIYVGEQDKHGPEPLYEALTYAALRLGLAGATVSKGLLGFGGHHEIRSAKLIELAENLPLVLDFVDVPANIARFLPEVDRLLSEAGSGGLVTLHEIQATHY